ncbi:Z1 domain-containing protein [Marinilactibacillus sp. XAAS-LB27]|uniref:Z1 domain-containing protein n=1 Tax=Marinilactibacillus sp. XAAS-LB27 TaxID=3114538 RepID=UPI002E1897F7|nr:Z1 domain-containing protein [Marinilactibacillus sp. XAAS-LB27]
MDNEFDFLDSKYSDLKVAISTYREIDGDEWEDIKKLNRFKYPKEMTLDFISQQFKSSNDTYVPSIKEWDFLVDEFEKRDTTKQVVLLGKQSTNDARISKDPGSQWQQYKKKLKNKGFSEKSIKEIQKSSFQIMQRLNADTINSSPTKGLVVGNVQSGKTANMAGLISMASDYGFNYFIIFSGVIDSLREQTANRLYKDLDSSGNLNWKNIKNPAVSSKNPESQWENIDLSSNSKNRYFTVCLKNKRRMDLLTRWLYSDDNKLEQLKILIIDDEADQASVNTKNVEEESRTAINKSLLSLVNGYNKKEIKAVNYVSYTATPYANVLNESSPESLYPKDFIFSLEPSEDYIGPEQIFGLQMPESHPSIDIVRSISREDYLQILDIHKGKRNDIPESFKTAIDWFFLSSAALRALGYKKPVTLLVHTSQKILHHNLIADAITRYLNKIHEDPSAYYEKVSELYNNETVDFTREDFINGMPNYSRKDSIPDYPEWDLVLKQLRRVMSEQGDNYLSHILLGESGEHTYHKGFHLVIDNSQSQVNDQEVRLVYPKESNKPKHSSMFIVVGGNTLSRGLTLEGLTTSYFLRTTKQADTLMQMGRWFGYRQNYEVFPRIWLNSLARERFEFLSQLNDELRKELSYFSSSVLTPEELGPRIRNSPNKNFISLTSDKKMQGAIGTNLDFTGFNKQTVLFTNERKDLENNLILTESFLNKLPEVDTSKKGNMIWRDVPFDAIRLYLDNFSFCENDIVFSNIRALLEWLDDAYEENAFSNWSIVLSSVGKIPLTEDLDNPQWNISGYSPTSVKRTRRGEIQEDGKTISIGSLRSPSDLYVDIPNLNNESSLSVKSEDVRIIREENGYGLVPQLLLYRIDKGDITDEKYKKFYTDKKNRFPLDFDEDIIGMNVLIPGVSKSGNLAKHLTIHLSPIHESQENNEEQFMEEEE